MSKGSESIMLKEYKTVTLRQAKIQSCTNEKKRKMKRNRRNKGQKGETLERMQKESLNFKV